MISYLYGHMTVYHFDGRGEIDGDLLYIGDMHTDLDSLKSLTVYINGKRCEILKEADLPFA